MEEIPVVPIMLAVLGIAVGIAYTLTQLENYIDRNKAKLALLNEINAIDKRLKRFKNDEEKTTQLMSRRDAVRSKLKTN